MHSEIVRLSLLTLHLIGLALGLGAASFADYSFIKAVKMGDRITPETVNSMRSISQVVWTGIGILCLSGIGLFFMKPAAYLASSGFLAKMLFVGVLVINGMFLNFYVTARLTTFNFSEIYAIRDAAWKARKLSFIFGAISTLTWYAVLLTAQFKSVVKFAFIEYVFIYLSVLVLAIFLALLLEHKLHGRHVKDQGLLGQLPTSDIINPLLQLNQPTILKNDSTASPIVSPSVAQPVLHPNTNPINAATVSSPIVASTILPTTNPLPVLQPNPNKEKVENFNMNQT